MDRLFLDANVLFSAAYREDAGVRRVWQLCGTELITSSYAVEEARRNLGNAERISELERLLEAVSVTTSVAEHAEYPGIEASGLAEKDLAILQAAVASGCTHLITGDRRHFGHLFGKEVAGVIVVRPGDYLAERG